MYVHCDIITIMGKIISYEENLSPVDIITDLSGHGVCWDFRLCVFVYIVGVNCMVPVVGVGKEYVAHSDWTWLALAPFCVGLYYGIDRHVQL